MSTKLNKTNVLTLYIHRVMNYIALVSVIISLADGASFYVLFLLPVSMVLGLTMRCTVNYFIHNEFTARFYRAFH